MPDYHVFVLDTPQMDESYVIAAVDQLREAIQAAAPHVTVHMHRGTELYDTQFQKVARGNWDRWAAHIAEGVHPQMYTPWFNAIAYLGDETSKFGHTLGNKAAMARKMLLGLNSDGEVKKVTSIEVRDSRNWSSGFQVCYT